MGVGAYFRLVRAIVVLAREGAFSIVDPVALPPFARVAARVARLIERPDVRRTGRVERLRGALNRLGPTYVKFGQTLATRPDIVGEEIARDLSNLQDKLPPFDQALVPKLLSDALDKNAATLLELSPPVAAASIAQVHKAVVLDAEGRRHTVAVKILRPGVARRFFADLESFYVWGRLAERFIPRIRRLKPVEVVHALERSARLELDLRLEAAAISEMAHNIRNDTGFIVPPVFWDQTAETVLTTGWVEGIPLYNFPAIEAAGLDRKALAKTLLQSFLRHAIRDGFFHADMHPGNLFADAKTGDVIAVDFGIIGRIGKTEQRFLADIVYGFITRDYRTIAQRHFDIGYVPKDQNLEDFASALRAIGEPLQGRTADQISMSRVLGQLFATTELFQMQTRPELVLLQKNMVLVEGTARALDPELDIWTIAEPIVGAWIRREAGPLGTLERFMARFEAFNETAGLVPDLVKRADALLQRSEIAEREHRRSAPLDLALKISGLVLAVLGALAALRVLLFGL
jgi:ubiquinone biosynthesis protein